MILEMGLVAAAQIAAIGGGRLVAAGRSLTIALVAVAAGLAEVAGKPETAIREQS
jgi:hypothetical protein